MKKAAILISEKDGKTAKQIRDALMKSGYRVAGTAASGERTVEMALARRPDILVIDMELGGGKEGIDAVREINRVIDLPAVYLVENADKKTLRRANDTDPYGYVPKPIDIRLLLAAIESALRRIHLGRERHFFESKTFGVVCHAADGAIIRADSTARNMVDDFLSHTHKRASKNPRLRTIREDGSEFIPDDYPWMDALRTGRPVRGAIMGLFDALQNTTRWIKIDSVPVRDYAGKKLSRVCSVLEDITPARRTELELRKARLEAVRVQNRFEAVMQALPVGVGIFDTKGGNIRSNRMFEEIWGGPRPATRSVDDYAAYKAWWMDTGKPVLPEEWASARALRSGKPVIGQLMRIRRFDGTSTYVHNSASPIRDDDGRIVGCAVAIQDITQRMHTLEALRESEERYRLLVETSPDGVIVHRDGRFLYANPAALLLYGADTLERLQAKSVLELIHPGDRDEVESRMHRVRNERTIPLHEVRMLDIEGRTIHVETVGSLINFQGSPAVQIIIRDITGRKKREEELYRLNRTLNALGSSRKAMARAVDESAYLQEICGIVVEDCGHAMVWIGFAEDDEAKSVRPAAYAGFEEGYIKTLKITWADTERGRGPTGTAIRTGRVSMCRNMRTDPAFSPWRDEAIKRGYASSIVLPLIEEGRAFGAITIYSREPDPFLEDEVKLLSEMADDLSYGIRALRLRAAHAGAEKALRLSEKNFRDIFNNAAVGLAHVSLDGRLMRINDSLCGITGFGADELAHKTLQEILHQEALSTYSAEIRRLVEGEAGNLSMEMQILRKDGSHAWIHLAVALARDDSGEPLHFVVSIQDITGRRQAEERLARELLVNTTLAGLSADLIRSDMTVQEISSSVFEQAMKITGSSHGYAAFIDPKTRESVAYHLTEMMMGKCSIAGPDRKVAFPSGPDGSYPGLWGHALNTGEPFYDNDARNHFSAGGVPQGHLTIEKFLCAPAIAGGELFGNIALANPKGSYGDEDLDAVKRIADLYALALQRINYENALAEMNQSLEQRVRERSAMLQRTNERLTAEIEDRKRAEEELKKSELKFRTVADFTYAAEYWIDAKGNYIYVSPSVERVTGYRPEEFMSDKNLLSCIIHQEDLVKFTEHLKEELQNENAGPMEIDFSIVRKDGIVRYISHQCNPVYDETGAFIGRRASNRDVTEQKIAEIRLREGEEVASALINTPTEPVLLVATDGTVLDASDEFARRLSLKKNMIIGASMFDIIGEEMSSLRRRRMEEVLDSGNALRFDEKTGDTWYDTIIFPIRNHKKGVHKMAIFSHDVTENRRLQKEIKEISELERRRIGQDLHDSLGQKLTGIAFLAEALRQVMKEKANPELVDMEEIIDHITDSIDHARMISSGLWSERLEQYDAAQALEELAAGTRNLFKIACTFTCGTKKRVDNRMVVTNLYFIARESTNNAIKHGKADKIGLSLDEDDDHLILKISDNGTGASKNTTKMTGIGLRIMKHRAALIGGVLETESSACGFTVTASINKDFIANHLE
jgi:PAS domain S-box-containing protein